MCVGADHGDMLGDKGLWGKGYHYNAALRVPLVCAGGDLGRGVVDSRLVSIMDVGGLAVDYATGKARWSSAASLRAAPLPDRHLSSGYKEWRAVLGRHDGVLYKLVCDRGLRRAFLYKVEEDPYDEHDLRPSARDREADLAAMKALLPLLPPAFRKVCAPKINAKSDFV